MGKLFKKEDDLKFIATHLDELGKSRQGKGVYFLFDTVSNGSVAYDIIKGIYPSNDTATGLDKRDFSFLFESRSVRDKVYDALSKEISDYKVKHDNEIQESHGQNEEYVSETVNVPEQESFFNSTTYIIIGAAAIILILLLWDNKKK